MNLNDIKIIPMSINNIDKVKDIETDQNINILSKESILNDIKDEHSCYFVAILDKEIVGYIASSIVIDNMDLESIVVKKEYQRKHIASYLLDFLFNLAKKKKVSALISPLKEIDFETIGLLLGLFLMIGGISEQGVIDAAANLLAKTGGGNIFLLYTVIVWASVLISAFIDNIPYVATMIPVIAGLASALNVDPTVFYFGLLSGATLGGNCTPIGASANITGIGILRKEGYIVKNTDFK